MRYLCLVYVDEHVLAGLPPGAKTAMDDECRDYRERLQRSGHLIIGEALQPVVSTTTLRLQGSSLSLRDGPVLDGCEQPAAFYLLEALDLNDAIRLASHIPPGRLGCVEVRALQPRAPP
jgi:hypothetical protein